MGFHHCWRWLIWVYRAAVKPVAQWHIRPWLQSGMGYRTPGRALLLSVLLHGLVLSSAQAWHARLLPKDVPAGVLSVALQMPLYPDPRAVALLEQLQSGAASQQTPASATPEPSVTTEPEPQLDPPGPAVTQAASQPVPAPLMFEGKVVEISPDVPPEPKQDPALPADFGGPKLQIELQVIVDVDGTVVDAQVLSSNGSDAENDLVLSAWRATPFWPGLKQGQPVLAATRLQLSKLPTFDN